MVSASHRVGERLVEDLILVEIDGALTAEEQAALAEHLRECDACRALSARHGRLHERLRASSGVPIPQIVRDEIWAGVASRRAAPQRWGLGLVGQLAVAVVVLLVAALASFVLVERTRVAAPTPVREVVVATDFVLPGGGSGTLTIEQGSAFASPGEQIGVGARAELRFARPPASGSAEIRFRREGDASYGLLGSAPDLTGSSRLSFGGLFPRLQENRPATYEVWLHLISDAGTADSTPVLIDVTATRRGLEARPH